MDCQISSEYELGHGLTQWVELRDVLSDLNAMEAPGIFHSQFTNTLVSTVRTCSKKYLMLDLRELQPDRMYGISYPFIQSQTFFL